jgi:mannan endo-1,4-beta-mannosidase
MRVSRSTWWHGGGQSHRLIAPVILLTLLTVGTLIYLLPGDTGPASTAGAAVPRTSTPALPAAEPSASPWTPPPAKTTPTGSHTIARPGTAPQIVRQVVDRTTILGRTATVTSTATAVEKAKHCWDFHWQQDAQAAYRANLSDPWGLDGDPGPDNGDGLACSQLPLDPSRSASKAIGAYEPPVASARAKSQLVSPQTDYFGVTEDGLPNATSQLDTIDRQLGKAPSSLGFFQHWDSGYPATKVESAWGSGALPVMTWMSMPSDGVASASYSFTHILAGDWDTYLYKFAGDIVRTNLPVVIRFDHEMNGNWYPWSAGHDDYNNSPARYVAVWRYIWSVFQKVGANEDVIWLYSPARVDNITGLSHTSSISADYPGDAYVDWVGATVYWRRTNQPTDYRSNFGATIDQLRAVTQKPMFFAEIGALQTDRASSAKQEWMANTLRGFLADPTIVGFSWFNNNILVPSEDPTAAHDWRFNASAPTLAAFKQQITDPRFAGGILPDQ